MKLIPVRGYSEADYPCLADYVRRQRRGRLISRLALAAGLAALAVQLSGCTISS
ncbi:MAG TPA: hypothetical protein VM221_12415 [Armatimonadota bacterium]|nr:hypothetical protein [Armatimonadota bacterium]